MKTASDVRVLSRCSRGQVISGIIASLPDRHRSTADTLTSFLDDLQRRVPALRNHFGHSLQDVGNSVDHHLGFCLMGGLIEPEIAPGPAQIIPRVSMQRVVRNDLADLGFTPRQAAAVQLLADAYENFLGTYRSRSA